MNGTNHNCQLLSAKQLSKMLSLSARTVWRLRSAGKLPELVKVGGSYSLGAGDYRKMDLDGLPESKGIFDQKGGRKMLAEIGKATTGETMAKPLQNAILLANKCYQIHSALSSEISGEK